MARHIHAPKQSRLTSGFTGSGGRALPSNGHPDIAPDRNSRHARRDTPYRVAATTAGQWSTSVSRNSTQFYREER